MSTPRTRTDLVVRLAGRSTEHPQLAPGERHDAENRVEQGGLAHAVGAEDRDEFVFGHVEIYIFKDPATTEIHARRTERQRVRRFAVHRARASSSACRSARS